LHLGRYPILAVRRRVEGMITRQPYSGLDEQSTECPPVEFARVILLSAWCSGGDDDDDRRGESRRQLPTTW